MLKLHNYNIILPKYLEIVKKKGSSFDITRARVGGASVILLLSSLLFSVPPSVRKVLGVPLSSGINSAKQAGKKGGGWGEGPEGVALRPYGVKIFARLLLFPFRLSKGKAEGGFGGPRSRASSLRGKNSATPERNQNEDSPATCLNTWRAEHHRKILFSLKEEKIGGAQNEKSKEYFSVVWRACRAVAGQTIFLGQFHSPRKIVCPAESKLVFRIFVKKNSNINQKTPPIFTFCEIVRNSLGAKRRGNIFQFR